MANSLGKKSSNILVWTLMVLLVLGLGGFGVSNFGSGVQSIGKVGDEEISVNAYARELQQELRAIEAQTGQPVSLAQAQAFGIDQSVLQRLVSNAALDDEAAKLGLSIGDEKVREQVLAIPAFRALDGTFDRDAYRQALSNAGLTEAEFEAGIRKDATRALLQLSVIGGITPPETYTTAISKYLGERRSFTWLRLDSSNLDTPNETPSEAQLTEYYQAHSEEFTVPESKSITYAWLKPEDILDTTPVDEDALKKLYANRSDEFQKPERRLIERLVYPTEEEALAAKARLDAGTADFDTLVAERGLKLDDIDLGDMTLDDLGEAGATLFAMTEPGVAGPLPSNLGPALFRMNGILAGESTSFEEARPILVEEFAMDAARRVIDGEIETIDNLLVGGATLEDLAKDTQMRLGTLDWYPGASEGLAAYDTFAEAATELTVDDYPTVTRLNDGGIFAMRLDEIVPPALRPLDEVRDEVVAVWDAEQTQSRLAALADSLVPQITANSDMAALDGASGLTATEEQGITREAFIENTPSGFVAEVFEMNIGEPRRIDGSGAAFIVRLDAVLPADPADPDMEKVEAALTSQAAQGIAQDIFGLFSSELTTSAGLTLNQSAINAVHAQFQ